MRFPAELDRDWRGRVCHLSGRTWRHTAEIRDRYGHRDFTGPDRFAFTVWLYRQACHSALILGYSAWSARTILAKVRLSRWFQTS